MVLIFPGLSFMRRHGHHYFENTVFKFGRSLVNACIFRQRDAAVEIPVPR